MKNMTLKIKIVSLLLLMVSGSLAQVQKKENKFTLNFDFSKPIDFPINAYIKKWDLDGNNFQVEEINITSSKYSYERPIAEPTNLVITLTSNKGKKNTFSLWVEAQNYTLLFDSDLKFSNINSLKENSMAKEIQALSILAQHSRLKGDSLARTVDYENRKISEAENRILYLRDSVAANFEEKHYKNLIIKNPKHITALYALAKYANSPLGSERVKINPDSIDKLYQTLSPALKELPTAKRILQKLIAARTLTIGNIFKDIPLKDTIGKNISISNFKGKYILIEFWASWCGPCRLENPNLIALHNKYKSANFQIVGITLDDLSSKREWLSAISDDKIGIWPQLSDFDGEAKKAYNVIAVPDNFLINPDGKIIAKKISGEALNEQLKKIFGR